MKNALNDIESFSNFKCGTLWPEKYQPDQRKYKNFGSTYFIKQEILR